MLPALVIVSALVVDYVSAAASIGAWGNASAAVGAVAVLALALHANVDDYFRVYNGLHQPNAMSLLTAYANNVNDDYRLVVFPSSAFNLTSEIPRFLVKNPDAVEVRNSQLELPLPVIPNRKGVAFLVQGGEAESDDLLAPVKAIYPQGVTDIITKPSGEPAFHQLSGQP